MEKGIKSKVALKNVAYSVELRRRFYNMELAQWLISQNKL